jgi:hypothetical protein
MKIIVIVACLNVASHHRSCAELAREGDRAIALNKYRRDDPARLALAVPRKPCWLKTGRIGSRMSGGRS